MARPRSDDKRKAILAAATRVIAEEGTSAPTAKIARLAGVAEGTLFTYFSNKDELLNQLYLQLKSELRQVMTPPAVSGRNVKGAMRHAWAGYVNWGVGHPAQRKALAQLSVSDRISDASKAAGSRGFGELTALLQGIIETGPLRQHPPAFVFAIMSSLAEATMDFMARDAARAESYSESGFEAFWHAVARKN